MEALLEKLIEMMVDTEKELEKKAKKFSITIRYYVSAKTNAMKKSVKYWNNNEEVVLQKPEEC